MALENRVAVVEGELDAELHEAHKQYSVIHPKPTQHRIYRYLLGQFITRLPHRSRWRIREIMGTLDERFGPSEVSDPTVQSPLYFSQTAREFYLTVGEEVKRAGVPANFVDMAPPNDVWETDRRLHLHFVPKLYRAYASLRRIGYHKADLTP
ncbi:hypothetical protein HY488_00240 [Candidatus Woesearchaeota archaeon]|nr:hypothetical protein [Candidatus Woesearchaeota archaeon]